MSLKNNSKNIIKEEIKFEVVDQEINDQIMLQFPKKELYKLNSLLFSKSNYTIKTIKQKLYIHPEKDEEEFCILSKKNML